MYFVLKRILVKLHFDLGDSMTGNIEQMNQKRKLKAEKKSQIDDN